MSNGDWMISLPPALMERQPVVVRWFKLPRLTGRKTRVITVPLIGNECMEDAETHSPFYIHTKVA